MSKHGHNCKCKDCENKKHKLKIVMNRYNEILTTIKNKSVMSFHDFVASAHYERKFREVIKKDKNKHGTSLRELTFTKFDHVHEL